jgi:transformation/transcription domain-associated protein
MNVDNETTHHPPQPSSRRAQLLQLLVNNQLQLFTFCSNIKSSELVVPLCQLCHLNSDLAHQIWIQLFIQMFNLLNPKQQQNLYGELTPFVASGSHCVQKQSQLSTLNTFIESFAMAKPVSLFLRPSLLAYLAKNHNLWHRVILLLENSLYTTSEMSLSQAGEGGAAAGKGYDLAGTGSGQQQQQNALQNVQHETFSSLSQLYGELKEEDYRAGLWHK